jgi:hypothetical protein
MCQTRVNVCGSFIAVFAKPLIIFENGNGGRIFANISDNLLEIFVIFASKIKLEIYSLIIS